MILIDLYKYHQSNSLKKYIPYIVNLLPLFGGHILENTHFKPRPNKVKNQKGVKNFWAYFKL